MVGGMIGENWKMMYSIQRFHLDTLVVFTGDMEKSTFYTFFAVPTENTL